MEQNIAQQKIIKALEEADAQNLAALFDSKIELQSDEKTFDDCLAAMGVYIHKYDTFYPRDIKQVLCERGELNLTFTQFLNAQDKQGRTAAHYALMRDGSNKGKDQNTAGGILNSIYVDKERDLGATRNAFYTEPRAALQISPFLIGASNAKLSSFFVAGKEKKDSALLFCQHNLGLLTTNGFDQMPYVRQQIGLLRNKTLAEHIMQGKLKIFDLLRTEGIDLMIKHNAGRTAEAMLQSFKDRQDLTELDKIYLLQISQPNKNTPLPNISATLNPNLKAQIKHELARITGKTWSVNTSKKMAALEIDDAKLNATIHKHLTKYGVNAKQGTATDSKKPVILIHALELHILKNIPKMEIEKTPSSSVTPHTK